VVALRAIKILIVGGAATLEKRKQRQKQTRDPLASLGMTVALKRNPGG
jgi:hypothetical protein